MKLFSVVLLLVAAAAQAQNFNPITDKYCTNTDGKANYSLILKNANVGAPTGYVLLLFANSKTNVIQSKDLYEAFRTKCRPTTYVYSTCNLADRNNDCKAENVFLSRQIVPVENEGLTGCNGNAMSPSNQYADKIVLEFPENKKLSFICEKVESN